MKREQLYVLGDGDSATYFKSEADSVMDAMEQRIKELVAKLKEKDDAMDTCRGLIESANVMSKSAKDKLLNRIKELEAENNTLNDALEDKSQVYAEIDADHIERINTCTATIRKLRDENARLKQANLDCNAHFATLKEDYDDLKAQVPEWISVKDRLPPPPTEESSEKECKK